jgi:hypothetical protein
MRPSRLLFPLLLLCLLLTGCRQGFVNTKGRIIRNGEAFHLAERQGLRLFFEPLEFKDGVHRYDSYAAEFHGNDGTFVVKGKDRKGLPPGKYRITMQLMQNKGDLFSGKLTGPASPFQCEITGSGSQEIVVNLDEAKGLPLAH